MARFDFVFICVDKPEARKIIIDALHRLGIPFIDVGMHMQASKDDRLMGQCRATLSTPTENDHIAGCVSFQEARTNDIYASDIQVAELNAISATLAVIKWKKLLTFYVDDMREHYTIYTIGSNGLAHLPRRSM